MSAHSNEPLIHPAGPLTVAMVISMIISIIAWFSGVYMLSVIMLGVTVVSWTINIFTTSRLVLCGVILPFVGALLMGGGIWLMAIGFEKVGASCLVVFVMLFMTHVYLATHPPKRPNHSNDHGHDEHDAHDAHEHH